MPVVRMNSDYSAPPVSGPLLSRLRFRLLLLVGLAVLPVLGLVVYDAVLQRNAAGKEATANAIRLVHLAADALRQHLDSAKQLLTTLAHFPDVHPARAERSTALLSSLLSQYPHYLNLLAVDPKGVVFASARPVTSSIQFRDRRFFKQVLATRKPTVGGYEVDPLTYQRSLELAQPVIDPATGQLVAVLILALDLRLFNQVASRMDLPEDSTLSIFNRQHVLIAHYKPSAADATGEAGQSAFEFPGLDEVLRQNGDGTVTGQSLDGVSRLYASTPLNRTGGVPDAHIVIGIPTHLAFAAANRILIHNLMILGVVFVLVFGAAWFFADYFVLRHVHGLVKATNKMQAGDLSARTDLNYGSGEIGQLARSFDEMAAALEQRVADLKQTQTQLQVLNEDLEHRVTDRTQELRRSNEDLEQFAYVASHDLQEPLRMVTSYLQLLKQRYRNKLGDPTAEEFLAFALDGATRMHEFIIDLLAYSRVGSQKRPMVGTSGEMVVDRALANLKVAIDESHATIVRGPLPTVKGDAILLTQLFQNLIGNALKFRADAPPKVEVHAQQNGAIWEFAVRDNGIGIAEQDFQRVFVVFQRLHTRDRYPGTGIGLSVCKKIIEQHGGRIRVESKLGRGTTFFFTLPMSDG